MLSNAMKQGSPRLSASSVSSHTVHLATVTKSAGQDLGNMAPDLVTARAVSDLELLEAAYTHSEDAVFDDDLALATEPGLSAFLDLGGRHGTTNGSGGVSAETRVGSNITSMYTKRSSPINVNMLNHMYAAGLPQPRRLTESVQRLVKPLPNPENSLPPGRACKSPGSSSSRHSSNGSASPGRASQGGARSPGANVSSASRNLSFDRMASSPSSVVSSSCVGSAGSYPPAFHMAQLPLGGATVNCISTAVIPAAPHPFATLHSNAGGRSKAGSGPASLSSSPVSQASSLTPFSSGGASTVVASSPSASASFSSSSAVPATLTVTPHSVPNMSAASPLPGYGVHLSHEGVPPRLQPPTHNHSMGGPPSPASLPAPGPRPPTSHPPTSLSVHPPLPALVPAESSQDSLSHCRVSGPAVSVSGTTPSVASAVFNHVPAVRLPHQAVNTHPHLHPHPHQQRLPVSVCNTSLRLDSVSSSGEVHPSSASCSLSVSSSASAPVSASTSFSAPSVFSSTTVAQQQQQQQGLAAASVANTTTTTTTTTCSTATTVLSSSHDLSVHGVVSSAGLAQTSIAVSSVCVSSMSAATTLAHLPVTPRPVTASHSVAPDCLQRLTSSDAPAVQSAGRLATSTGPAALPDSNTRGIVEERTEHGGPPPPVLRKHFSVASSRMDTVTKLTSSGMTVPLPASSHTAVSQTHSATVASSGGDQVLKPPAVSHSNLPVSAADTSVPKLQGGGESWSQPPELKEGDSKEKEEVGAGKALVSAMPPLSHHSVQDNAQAENLHSKPPLLHPAPPLTIPTVLPSATPPPPPLTPVLPQDLMRKEAAPSSGQSTPPLSTSAEGQQAELTAASFNLREAPTTASPLTLVPDLATVDGGDGMGPVDCDSVDGKVSAKEALSGLKDAASTCPSSSSSSSETDGQKPVSGEPTSSADPSSDESNPKTRRFTRKRKSTHSESDNSSGEPAPKLSCMEGAQGNGSAKGGEGGKTVTLSEHPPKLTREGKRSHIAEKKEEEKGGRKEEEKGERKEERKEEGKGGKREEEKAASKNMGPHHDRNILDATPEEIAKKMAAATTGGKRRVHYAYVPEKSLNQCKHGTFPLVSCH